MVHIVSLIAKQESRYEIREESCMLFLMRTNMEFQFQSADITVFVWKQLSCLLDS